MLVAAVPICIISGVTKIRIAIESDIPEIHRIRMSVRENILLDPDSIQPADTLRMITRDGRGWVCDVDGRTVGFAIADLVRAYIWALFVEPEFERRGIGRRLHERCWTGCSTRARKLSG